MNSWISEWLKLEENVCHSQPRVYHFIPTLHSVTLNIPLPYFSPSFSDSVYRTQSGAKINIFSRRKAFYYKQRVTVKNIFDKVLMDERKNVQISLGSIEKRELPLRWYTLPNVSCSYWIQSIYLVFHNWLRLFCKKKSFLYKPPAWFSWCERTY